MAIAKKGDFLIQIDIVQLWYQLYLFYTDYKDIMLCLWC